MVYKYLLLLMVPVVLFSCKKEKGTTTYPPAPVPTVPPVPRVLLKDIEIAHLPSPYYHFEYDAAGKISFVSFASGFNQYNVAYEGGRINEMRNNIIVNKDRLQYLYDNAGRVSTVRYADSTGVVYTNLNLTYNEQKVVRIERQRKSGTEFITDKTMVMTYQPDGNLMEITYHYLPFGVQTEGAFTDRFEQYDNKMNVDGFSLVHNDFFDHLVLLPGVQFQKNNPGKETRTGDGLNYTVDYTYTYNDNNAPLTKTGAGIILNGSDAGKRFPANSIFSYY
jgi:hypothetical protein